MDEIVALYARGETAGRVTGSAPRSRVRARNLPHAAAKVLLRDGAGRVYVHRRTDTKDVYPGLHDAWAGGVLLAGEEPDAGAARELAEELGVRCRPRPCFRLWYRDARTDYLAFCYEARWDPAVDAAPVHQPEEVACGRWTAWDELTARLAEPGWPFMPDGRVFLREYLRRYGPARGAGPGAPG